MENPNNMKLPSWISEEFFLRVVRHYTGDRKAEVEKFIIKPISAAAELVASTTILTEIIFSTALSGSKSLSVVIKFPPDGDIFDDIESSPIFEIEQSMYNGPLNDIKELLESVGDSSEIQPKLIYSETKLEKVIVLEDLNARGFIDISQPLEEYESSKTVFERLAKFHAASFFLINEKKADFSHFKDSIFDMSGLDFIMDKWFNESIITLAEVLESWDGYEEYAAKLRAFKEDILEWGRQLYQPDPDGFNVLNHGDFHIKNLMFKEKGDGIEDLIFLDFQMPILASPCVDLFYALYNMISDENRLNRRDEIIHDYHNEFSSTLRRLGFIGKIPSLLDLQMSLLKHGKMEVMKCAAFYMFFFVKDVGSNNNELFGPNSKELKRRIFKLPRFESFIKAELPRLVNLGLL